MMKRKFQIPKPEAPCAQLSFDQSGPWLAPLAGYSDLPFRLLCRGLGAAACETEMISAKGLAYGSPASADLLASAPGDAPLVVQLFGSEPEGMAEAMRMLRKAGYNLFDCNMGCPVRKIMRQKAGAALLADPERCLAVARALLDAAAAQGDDLPLAPAQVGFKLRITEDAAFIQDLGKRLEDMGAAWLCLHPRTAAQGYGGEAAWERIARLVEAVAIPVVASGDLMTAASAEECLRQTGAACVMFARGALKDPLIFRDFKALMAGDAPRPRERGDLKAVIERHVELTRIHCGDRRAFCKIRSFMPRYVKHLRGVGGLRERLRLCQSWKALAEALDDFLYEEEPCA